MEKEKKSANMIKLCVYFHTSGSGVKLAPKVAFKTGAVSMPTNHKHGIRASDVGLIYFGGSQGTMLDAIKKCLTANKIKFVEDGKEKEYRKLQELQDNQDFFDQKMNL